MEFIEPTRGVREFADAVLRAVNCHMFGMDEVVRLTLVALYTDGHVLLEGNPGFGKTELVKTLGAVLKLPFGRIQFTPDLMPADITGTFMPDLAGSSKWKFWNGPIFTSLLLADEINRATPKTQSAMLEAMAERQVTVLGEKKELDTPFMVLATQNPIDHEGTYNLPEAQADRFMFKITMPVPNADTLHRIIEKQVSALRETASADNASATSNNPLLPKSTQESTDIIKALRERIQRVKRLRALKDHVGNIFLASNRRFDEMEDCSEPSKNLAADLVNKLLTYGLGPRAAIALTLGAQAWALLFPGDSSADRADGFALARVMIPTLRHRIKLDLDWAEGYREITDRHRRTIWFGYARPDGIEGVGLLERMLADFCCSTAPQTSQYQTTVVAALDQVLKERGW